MVVGIVDAAANELVAVVSGVEFAIPLVVVVVVGIAITAHAIVSFLVRTAERTEHVFVDCRLRNRPASAPFRVVVGETYVELCDKVASRRNTCVKPGGTVRMGVFDLLHVRQRIRLHQEETEPRVYSKKCIRHSIGVG